MGVVVRDLGLGVELEGMTKGSNAVSSPGFEHGRLFALMVLLDASW